MNSKVFALTAAALILLIVDAALLAMVLRASDLSERAGKVRLVAPPPPDTAAAVILPTRDPRTPRPTRTPASTPALPPPAAGAPLAVPASPSSIASARSSVSEATRSNTPAPEHAVAAPDATATSSTIGIASASGMRAPAALRSEGQTPEPSPTATETVLSPEALPTETPSSIPSETLEPTATETPSELSSFDDLPALEAYFRVYRTKVAGVSFDIVGLTVDTTGGGAPRFVLQVAASEAKDVFAAQPADAIAEYGRGILDDARSYLGDGFCEIAVESTYQAADITACSADPTWCRPGELDPASNKWTITRIYVRGSFAGGPYVIRAWNSPP